MSAGQKPQTTGAIEHPVSVCHVTSGDRWAGAEVQVATALRQLSQRQDLAVSALVFNDGRLVSELREANVPVQVIDESQNGFFSIVDSASKLLAAGPPDILHSHGYKANTVCYAVARRCGIRHLVRSQHGLTEPFSGLRRWKNRVLMTVDGLIGRHATDRIISVSQEMRSHLVQSFPPEKVVVIENGLDCERVGSGLTSSEAKLRLGLAADAPVVGYAGRLEPVKQLDRLIDAAGNIVRATPAAVILIVGDGKEEQRLRGLAERSPVREHIKFLGHRDDIYDVLRAMDVFVLCSQHEGLPMVLLEAMWMGVTTVAGAMGGPANVIQDGISGVLVDAAHPEHIADACTRVIRDPEQRRRMAEKAHERVRAQYSAETNAAQLAELYLSLVREDPNRITNSALTRAAK